MASPSTDSTLARRQKARVLVDSVKDYAIFELDPAGLILTWNEGARVIKGYADEEVIGTSFSRFYTSEDVLAGKPAMMLRLATEHGRIEDEGWRVRKDGSRFWADVVISAVRDDDGELTGFVKVTRDLTERRRAEEATRRRARQNAGLAAIGLAALQTTDLDCVLERCAETLVDVLDVDVAGVFELAASGRALQLRAGVGWPAGLDDAATLSSALFEEARAAATGVALDVGGERDLPAAPLFEELGVESGVAVAVRGAGEHEPSYGALVALSRTPRTFDDDERHFVAAVGNTLAAAIGHARVTRRLRVAEHETDEERMRSERAEQALEERDEFISVAAHELRTPLTALQLKLETLARAVEAGSESVRLDERLAGARKQVSRMGELVERLLDVSHVTSRRLTLAVAELDVEQLVSDVVEEFQEQARSVGSPLRLTSERSAAALWDGHRMAQAIGNVISNALKYGAGAPVTVHLRVDDGVARIEVADRGIGIREEDAVRIFERFERAAPTRHFGGLGVGLYVAREIVRAHQGDISARPRSDGNGAVFSFTLPIRSPRLTPTVQTVERE